MERDLDIKLKEANEMLEIQKDNYDYNPYMFGMYNGMEFIISIIEEREPIFLNAPAEWTGEVDGRM